MKYAIKEEINWESDRIDQQDILQVRCSHLDAEKLVLGLHLLSEELVASIILNGRNDKTLELTRGKGRSVRAEAVKAGRKTTVTLPSSALDAVIRFYLVYCRDGLADVSHIDVESDRGGYITFYAADVKTPMSGSQLKDYLRDME